jgi:aspartate/methionine/tyrosine aminotransferase
MDNIVPSASMAMAQKIVELKKERSIIDMTWGQPDFDTPEYIKAAAWDAVKSGKNGYTPSPGIPELRAAIAAFHQKRYGAAYNPQTEILVTPGAKQGLMYMIQVLIDPGDEVVLFEPCWLSYRDMILFNGGTPRFIPAVKDLQPDISRLKEAVTPKTKAILINSPVNPTGYVFKKNDLEEIARVAIHHDLYVIADEIYDRIVFTEFVSLSELKELRDRLIIVNGFSKAYAMTGWRIGYLLAPAAILTRVRLIHEHTATCASAPSQYAAVAALEGSQETVKAMRSTYHKRRDLFLAGLQGASFNLVSPEGTFYAMLDVSPLGASAENNADTLLEKFGIASINGISYGPSASRFVRLSLTQNQEQLALAVKRLKSIGA